MSISSTVVDGADIRFHAAAAALQPFQSALAQMERAPQLPVAMLATEAGYFDQSHLTGEVARYTGATPGRLISEHVSDFSKTRCDVPF
jgi:AraC-like DNA-binding protein